MSLLKTLQRKLTCVDVPWTPVADAENCYLINEIVLGEECDLSVDGSRKSHFEIYLDAMDECGANQHPIQSFLNLLKKTGNPSGALGAQGVTVAMKNFVETTFKMIACDKPWVHAAVFTFGREDLIPEMFINILDDLATEKKIHCRVFRYYLERHIEIDGGHHGQLALEMTERICGNDEQKWVEAIDAINESLLARTALWDAVLAEILDPTHQEPA